MKTAKRKNASFRKTKKAARRAGAKIPSSRRAKQAVKYPGQTTISRALHATLAAALGKRKSARVRIRRVGRRIEIRAA